MKTDEIDTVPTVLTDATSVEFGSIELDAGERGEIILAPSKPMRNPTLYVSNSGKIAVESVLHGRVAITSKQWTAETLKMGRKLDVLVSKDEPVKVVVVGLGPGKSSVGVSLVATPPDEKGS
jgi:hypothetical protein